MCPCQNGTDNCAADARKGILRKVLRLLTPGFHSRVGGVMGRVADLGRNLPHDHFLSIAGWQQQA
jgi:hypothetical protein